MRWLVAVRSVVAGLAGLCVLAILSGTPEPGRAYPIDLAHRLVFPSSLRSVDGPSAPAYPLPPDPTPTITPTGSPTGNGTPVPTVAPTQTGPFLTRTATVTATTTPAAFVTRTVTITPTISPTPTITSVPTATTTATAGAGGFETQRSPSTATLNAVAATADGAVVWAVGDGGTILKTVDKGVRWTGNPSGVAVSLYGVAAVSATTAYAAGDAGLVLRTVDGGATWRWADTGADGALSSVAVDGQTVWAAGQNGSLRRSSDGGASWVAVTTNTTEWLTVGARGGTVLVAGNQGAVRRSTDGGATWTTGVQPFAIRSANLPPASVASASGGWWVARTNSLFWSGDDGVTWGTRFTASISSSATLHDGVALRDAHTAWLLIDLVFVGTGTNTSVDVVTDGTAGVVAPPRTTLTTPGLRAIASAGPDAWLVGTNGTILHRLPG